MSFGWYKTAIELLAKGNPQVAMNVFDIYAGPFPMVHDTKGADGLPGPRDQVELVNARVHKVVLGTDEYVTVTLCRIEEDGTPSWGIYCGDHQVKGSFKLDGKKLASKLRAEGKVSTSLCNTLEAQAWVSKAPTMAACNFFNMQARSGRYCSHTQQVLSQLDEATLNGMAAELLSWQAGATIASASAVAGKPDSPEEEAFLDAAFIQPVLLAGERGSGKTVMARSCADRFDAVYLELQCHAAMEAWELRAHDRSWNGKVYTVLGKLAEAVYWIQKGKRVVLVMDEYLNMNPIYTTALNSALSLTTRETYLIETGRIIEAEDGSGIGLIETVEVPANMLWVVATTNVGARYKLEDINPSVRARFQIILLNTDPMRTESIVEKTLAKYEMPLEFAANFKDFINGVQGAVEQQLLDEEATTRMACNVIRAVALRAKRDGKVYRSVKEWRKEIKQQLFREQGQVVSFAKGPFASDQVTSFKVVVDSSFG